MFFRVGLMADDDGDASRDASYDGPVPHATRDDVWRNGNDGSQCVCTTRRFWRWWIRATTHGTFRTTEFWRRWWLWRRISASAATATGIWTAGVWRWSGPARTATAITTSKIPWTENG